MYNHQSMPILANAKKALRVSKRKSVFNNMLRTRVKTTIDNVKKKATSLNLSQAFSVIDKAVKKNLLHKNKAARLKGQIAKVAKDVKPTKTTVVKSAKVAAKSAAKAVKAVKVAKAVKVVKKATVKVAAKPVATPASKPVTKSVAKKSTKSSK
jgi:small subunit ribosomal protein S20